VWSKGWIAAAVIIPLVILIVVIGCVAMRNEKLREKIPFLKTLSTWKVGYLGVNQPIDSMEPLAEEEPDATEFNIQIDKNVPDTADTEDIDNTTKPKQNEQEPKNLMETEDEFNPRV